jgi:hypothetical protein
LDGVTYRPLPDPPLIDQVLLWRADRLLPSLEVLLAPDRKKLAER